MIRVLASLIQMAGKDPILLEEYLLIYSSHTLQARNFSAWTAYTWSSIELWFVADKTTTEPRRI